MTVRRGVRIHTCFILPRAVAERTALLLCVRGRADIPKMRLRLHSKIEWKDERYFLLSVIGSFFSQVFLQLNSVKKYINNISINYIMNCADYRFL